MYRRHVSRTCALAVGAALAFCFLLTTDVNAQRETIQVEVVEHQSDVDPVADQTKAIREALQKRVNLRFNDSTLAEIAQAISDELEIPIHVDENTLKTHGIDPSLAHDLHMSDVSASEGLRTFLHNQGAGYGIVSGRLHFMPAMVSIQTTTSQFYDVTDLVKHDSRRVQVIALNGETPVNAALNQLLFGVQNQAATSTWGGPFRVTPVERQGKSYLQVVCNELQHEVITSFLKLQRDKQPSDESSEDSEPDDGEPELRVYPIRMKEGVELEEYIRLLAAVFGEPGGSNSVKAVAGMLVIRESRQRHRQIEQLLVDLELLEEQNRGNVSPSTPMLQPGMAVPMMAPPMMAPPMGGGLGGGAGMGGMF